MVGPAHNVLDASSPAPNIVAATLNLAMSKVFVYDPEKRNTATQLLQDPSFGAIMDRYDC